MYRFLWWPNKCHLQSLRKIPNNKINLQLWKKFSYCAHDGSQHEKINITYICVHDALHWMDVLSSLWHTQCWWEDHFWRCPIAQAKLLLVINSQKAISQAISNRSYRINVNKSLPFSKEIPVRLSASQEQSNDFLTRWKQCNYCAGYLRSLS